MAWCTLPSSVGSSSSSYHHGWQEVSLEAELAQQEQLPILETLRLSSELGATERRGWKRILHLPLEILHKKGIIHSFHIDQISQRLGSVVSKVT